MARILIGNIKPTLVNNALTTQAGLYALDAAMGYTLDDKIGKVSSDLANKMHIIETGYYQFQDVPAKGYAEFDVIYTKAYTTTPYVIAFNSSIGCRLIAIAGKRTQIGHKLQVYNPSDAAVSGDIRWITFL